MNVTSEPPGVKVRSNSGQFGRTPCTFSLIRNKNATITADFEGETQQRTLHHGLQGWFWGNILIGGIIGGAVDAGTGACDKLSADEVHFDFASFIAERQRRREEYIMNHPDIDEKILYCIETGRVIEGMDRQQIIAALGEPTQITENVNGTFLIYRKYDKSKIYSLQNDVYQRPKVTVEQKVNEEIASRETIIKL